MSPRKAQGGSSEGARAASSVSDAVVAVKDGAPSEGPSEPGEPLTGVRSSVLFAPVRVIGRVTCGIPFALSAHGVDSFVCCSVGRGFHLYDTKKLQQQVASPRLPFSVRCLCCKDSFVYVALKNKIVAFNRLNPVQLYAGGHSLSIDGILAMGPVLLSHSKAEVIVWDRETGKLLRKLPLQGSLQVSRFIHPDTYINKILVARGGRLELWNFNTGQKLHEFRCMDTPSPTTGDTNGSITALAQSGSPDVVAVGFSGGRVCVIDIRGDELLLEFQHSSAQGVVTSLAFRPDDGRIAGGDAAAAAVAALVSGCANGALCIWSLSEGRLLETIPNAHADAVVHVQFLPGQPVMLTNGGSRLLWLGFCCSSL